MARTVTWKSEELQKYFSDDRFDGKRVALTSKGSYSESEMGIEKLRLSWDVDLSLPVVVKLSGEAKAKTFQTSPSVPLF